MGDSVAYEYNFIYQDSAKYIDVNKKFVKFNGHFVSVEITNNKNKKIQDFKSYLTITNLSTQKTIGEVELDDKNKYKTNEYLQVIMYSDTILWIGLKGFHYGVCIFDLTKDKLIKHFTMKAFNSIINFIEQKYFIITQYELPMQLPLKVYTWANLLNLENITEPPVYTFKRECDLFPIDWSESSIEKFNSVRFVQTHLDSTQLDFLDGNFFLVITLNIGDLFPDYQPIPNSTKKQIVNDNCLLFMEKFDGNLGDNNSNEKTNYYCWDFTNNKPIIFTNNILINKNYYLTPYRDFTNTTTGKIKHVGYRLKLNSPEIFESIG